MPTTMDRATTCPHGIRTIRYIDRAQWKRGEWARAATNREASRRRVLPGNSPTVDITSGAADSHGTVPASGTVRTFGDAEKIAIQNRDSSKCRPNQKVIKTLILKTLSKKNSCNFAPFPALYSLSTYQCHS